VKLSMETLLREQPLDVYVEEDEEGRLRAVRHETHSLMTMGELIAKVAADQSPDLLGDCERVLREVRVTVKHCEDMRSQYRRAAASGRIPEHTAKKLVALADKSELEAWARVRPALERLARVEAA